MGKLGEEGGREGGMEGEEEREGWMKGGREGWREGWRGRGEKESNGRRNCKLDDEEKHRISPF